jgi:EAL domain-containing protein (putative c-di-GMP-specific phosphodiesterase class I)
MRVTVEGVETSDQVDFLYDADADQVQGFYFGKPVSAAEAHIDILKGFSKTGTGNDTKLRVVKQAG